MGFGPAGVRKKIAGDETGGQHFEPFDSVSGTAPSTVAGQRSGTASGPMFGRVHGQRVMTEPEIVRQRAQQRRIFCGTAAAGPGECDKQ